MTGDRCFPDGFEWGTATAAHQIEGGNWNNDWWRWEHTPGSGCVEPSGDACDSWHRWPEDVALCAELGLGSYRFSVEWSRVEPEEGEFSTAALDHYRRQCEELRQAGVRPVVTLHHFTTPRWLADRGGWTEPATAEAFGVFAERVVTALGPLLHRVCTLNEPNIVAAMGYRFGVFPPGQRDQDARRRATDVFNDAHRRAVEVVRGVAPEVPVGLTLSMTDYQAVAADGRQDQAESRRDHVRNLMEDRFLDATGGDDFLGVQTYSRTRIGPDGALPNEDGVPVLPMGYEFWPQSLAATLRRAWDYTGGQVPLLVTENGIGTDDDDQRIAYVEAALDGVLACLAEGIDVRGYTYWSLLDNFEWAFGYGPRFGLVSVDRSTFVRTPKASAHWLGAVVAANAMPGAPA